MLRCRQSSRASRAAIASACSARTASGFVRPNAHTHALLGHGFARAGRLALLSQSGAVCNAIIDWANGRDIGFSLAASIGNGADVTFGDALDYLALDYETSAILVYTEGVVRARRFMSGLRAAARIKPVIVLKAGREQASVLAAATHSASLVGSDAVFESALRRAGAVRATTLEQLFFAAELLSERRRTAGNRLAIVTNAGGIGVMAADRAAQCGLSLAGAQRANRSTSSSRLLPPHWDRRQPDQRLWRCLDRALRASAARDPARRACRWGDRAGRAAGDDQAARSRARARQRGQRDSQACARELPRRHAAARSARCSCTRRRSPSCPVPKPPSRLSAIWRASSTASACCWRCQLRWPTARRPTSSAHARWSATRSARAAARCR